MPSSTSSQEKIVLSELQRRVLGNLTIPRNPVEVSRCLEDCVALKLREIPSTPGHIDDLLRGEEVTHQSGTEKLDPSWVTKLGVYDNVSKLASDAQKSKKTIPMADEQAQIYERRLVAPNRAWRTTGDLWMLSPDGLAELHAPTPDARAATPGEVQAFVDAEWSRVLREPFVPGETSLGNKVLEDEFLAWFALVADDCERTWGVRPTAPMAGGASGYSDYYEAALLNAENQKTALGAVVDPWYMALSVAAFTDVDTGTTADDGTHKPTYGGYARKSVAGTDMNTASGTSGSVTNANAIVFANWSSGSSTIIAAANTSASTVGDLRKWGDTGTSVTVDATHYPAQFAAGQYTTQTN
jgi:hypothetical protein